MNNDAKFMTMAAVYLVAADILVAVIADGLGASRPGIIVAMFNLLVTAVALLFSTFNLLRFLRRR